MADDDDVTLGEIVRRLDSLVDELRHMAQSFVRTDLYESQRTDTGRRIGDVEQALAALRSQTMADKKDTDHRLDAQKDEGDRRFRTLVNMALGSLLTFFGGLVLLVLQLVAK